MPALPSFAIAGRSVGDGYPVYVIAEAGVCHFGELETAFRLVDMAVTAGADAVKFQTYTTELLVSGESPFWRERLKYKELTRDEFRSLKQYCDEKNILFLSTPHDESAADFLQGLGVPAFKIGSGEVTNTPFLQYIARKGMPMLISTGMYTLAEVKKAREAVRAVGNNEVMFLHCVTSYPTQPDDVNLRAIATMKRELDVPIGYSDHTVGITIPVAAVAAGACVIEKHIAVDKTDSRSYDCAVACDAEDLPALVNGCRIVSRALGSGIKQPATAELQSREWARKSIVAARDIPAGTELHEQFLTFKRPGTGIAPAELRRVIGRRTLVEISADTLLHWEHLSAE